MHEAVFQNAVIRTETGSKEMSLISEFGPHTTDIGPATRPIRNHQ